SAEGSVNEERTLCHRGKSKSVEHVPWVRGKWRVHGDEVCHRKSFFQRPAKPGVKLGNGGRIRFKERIKHCQLHSESPGSGSNQPANPSQTANGQRFAVQFHAGTCLAIPA